MLQAFRCPRALRCSNAHLTSIHKNRPRPPVETLLPQKASPLPIRTRRARELRTKPFRVHGARPVRSGVPRAGMLPVQHDLDFGEAPLPLLNFLRLKEPPPKVKKALKDITKVAKFRVGDPLVIQTPKSGESVRGLRSASVTKVELADPNYHPKPRTDLPEPLYLVELDSTATTHARTSPKWVRETDVHPRPLGVQDDAFQSSRTKWNRVWDYDQDFIDLAEKEMHENVKRTLALASRKLLSNLSASDLYTLPVSRLGGGGGSSSTISPKLREAIGFRKEAMNSRSVSSSELRYGIFGSTVRPDTAPARSQSPKLRRRKQGCPRQRRVRVQVPHPPEIPPIRDSQSRSPWYSESYITRPVVTKHGEHNHLHERELGQKKAVSFEGTSPRSNTSPGRCRSPTIRAGVGLANGLKMLFPPPSPSPPPSNFSPQSSVASSRRSQSR